MYGLFDTEKIPSKFISLFSTIELAVERAEELKLEHFMVFPANGGSYVYCSCC